MDTTTLRTSAASLYEKNGWSVIPVDPDTKQPLIPWKQYQTKSAGLQDMETWGRRFPKAGIAVIAGAVSGLLVLDADGTDGVAEAMQRGLPNTPTVRTPNGGMHCYFKSNQSYLNGAKLGTSKKIDVRSDAGYVVAPYSKRVDGKRYIWTTPPDVPLAAAPNWFLSLLTTPTSRGTQSDKDNGSSVRLGSTGGGGGSDGLNPWLAKLSPRIQALIAEEHEKGVRSDVDYAIVIALLCAGANYDVIEQFFVEYPFGSKYREPGNGSRYLELSLKRASAKVIEVMIKYADIRDYEGRSQRVHLRLDHGNTYLRAGITVPGTNVNLMPRWKSLFNAVSLPVPTCDIPGAVRKLVGRKMRVEVNFNADRANPVVGFYKI